MGRPILKAEHIAVIEELGAQGRSDQFIAQRLKARFDLTISSSAVHWHRLKLCAEPESCTYVRPVPTEPKVEKRGDHVVRRFTQAEDEQLLALAAVETNIAKIGRQLGRKPNSITGRLMTLARHDDRRERANG